MSSIGSLTDMKNQEPVENGLIGNLEEMDQAQALLRTIVFTANWKVDF